MLSNKVSDLRLVRGKIRLENNKMKRVIQIANTIRGRVILKNEMPALFIAAISKCSVMFPTVMIHDNRIANGSALGTVVNET